jgi:hypothetical protein
MRFPITGERFLIFGDGLLRGSRARDGAILAGRPFRSADVSSRPQRVARGSVQPVSGRSLGHRNRPAPPVSFAAGEGRAGQRRDGSHNVGRYEPAHRPRPGMVLGLPAGRDVFWPPSSLCGNEKPASALGDDRPGWRGELAGSASRKSGQKALRRPGRSAGAFARLARPQVRRDDVPPSRARQGQAVTRSCRDRVAHRSRARRRSRPSRRPRSGSPGSARCSRRGLRRHGRRVP